MKVRIQKSCDAPESWPLYSADVHKRIASRLAHGVDALVDPYLSTLLDEAFELTDVPTIRHQYVWVTFPGAQIVLRHSLDMAIFRFATVEEHADAQLETFISPLMHPNCHTPPLPIKQQMVMGADGFWRSVAPPNLTNEQLEWPGYCMDEGQRTMVCEGPRLFVLKRGVGGQDAGVRITLSTKLRPAVCLVRTCAPIDSICAVDALTSPTRGWYHNGADGNGDVATYVAAESWSPRLRHVDHAALTLLLAPQRRYSLSSSLELLKMAEEMPTEGLFSGKHIKDIYFTQHGQCHWRQDENVGHIFVNPQEKYLIVYFALDHLYKVSRAIGGHTWRGHECRGLRSPWRAEQYRLEHIVAQRLQAVDDRDQFIAKLHETFRTQVGPITSFAFT